MLDVFYAHLCSKCEDLELLPALRPAKGVVHMWCSLEYLDKAASLSDTAHAFKKSALSSLVILPKPSLLQYFGSYYITGIIGITCK